MHGRHAILIYPAKMHFFAYDRGLNCIQDVKKEMIFLVVLALGESIVIFWLPGRLEV